jgi:xanthine dehydrogenase large subunit
MAGVVGTATPHDSAPKHVRGDALYIDDMPEPRDLLHAAIGLARCAHGRVLKLDLDAVTKAPGVHSVMTARDLPASNDIGPALPGDPVFADGLVEYWGQSLFAVAADSMLNARRAAAKAVVEYEELPALLSIEQALAARDFVIPTKTMERGNPEAALSGSPHRLSGRFTIGGQDHFYLEGQIAMAVPGEDVDMLVYSSTQHPSEVQHLVAKVLGLPDHAIQTRVRRLGGAFGGKETQAAIVACVASLLAQKTGRPVKLRLDRDDDMMLTGKRHDFIIDYDVGFDQTGHILGAEFMLASRCGMSPDLSGPINDRAMLHIDNCYYLENIRVVSHRCRTHTVSNTAFRGFGGPQGMIAIEYVIDEIARYLRLDPLTVRKRNFYGIDERNVTPYGMVVEDNIMPKLAAKLEASSDYQARRRAVDAFNATSPWIKKGLAMTPVKFGISFTMTFLNQAGALVHVYTDGSVMLNHGGTEMGQGLFVKVAQVVASEFGLPLDAVKITPTDTAKVPNTSATAASSGADMNGKAAQIAARSIRDRLARIAAERFGVKPGQIVFADGKVGPAKSTERMKFGELVRLAYTTRTQLSATGFYKTPKLQWDGDKYQGRPFFYFAYGAAVTEVAVDTLTGEYKILRVDILHDCGRSLNPAIDQGQIEGGFVQGMGWLTSEELHWDKSGRLTTHAPSTYKIPASSDVPEDFRVAFYQADNLEATVHRSKAVGEPPLMLGISAFLAIKDAVAASANHMASPALDAPATPERVLLAIEALRARVAASDLAAVAE